MSEEWTGKARQYWREAGVENKIDLFKQLILLTVFLFGFTASAHAEIYKCQDESGGVAYSEIPCPGGSKLERNDQPRASRLPQGLRESEKALLEELEKREREERQTRETARQQKAVPPSASDTRTCPGITLTQLRTYTRRVTYTDVFTVTVGPIARRRGFRHCASARIDLSGYYGAIRTALAGELQKRLYAILADGSALFAQTVELSDGPNRIGRKAEFNTRFCFEPVAYDLADIDCK